MVTFGQLFALLCALNIGLGQARNVLVKRQADEEDVVVVSNEETSDDIKDKNDTSGQEGVDLIKVIRDAVGGALDALRGVVEAKQEAVKPIVSAAQRTAELVQDSQVLERIRETASLVIDAKVNAFQSLLKVVTDALSGPQVLERVSGTVDFAGNVFRVGVCHLFCPLQANGTDCRQDHCEPRNETAKDPDYVYYDNYVDFDEVARLDLKAEDDDNDVSKDDV